MSRSYSFRVAVGVAGLLLSFAANNSYANGDDGLVFIDFNDLTHGVDVTNQYEGIHFELDGLPGEGPVAYALKDGDPANTGNPVTVLGGADGLAITPFNPAPGFPTNCLPCLDFTITFDTPITYFSILAIDAEEGFTATAYNGAETFASVSQGTYLGFNSASVFNGPVYKVELGSLDGQDFFDRVVFDINITGGDGPELFDNMQIAPIPEPEIYAMMAVGMGIMGWAARRRKRKRSGVCN